MTYIATARDVTTVSDRLRLLARSVVAGAFGLLVLAATGAAQTAATPTPVTAQAEIAAPAAIRPFRVNVAEDALVDLRRRIAATRWPDRETVSDQSQGVPLAKLQELVRYWGTAYDWRKAEAKLNGLPQFLTTIDGVDIHFVHVRSRYPNAMPLIMTHGWPGSVFELLKTVGPLTDPTAYGGRAEDAFDLVLPSIPGFGFSGKPTDTGWGPDRIARAWAELMKRLGYTRYVAQGGDWGSPISSAMARQAPVGLLGIHINLPAVVPPDVAAMLAAGGPAPAGLSDKERAAFDALSAGATMGDRSYAGMMGARPQTIGYALTDSPAGLAAWMLGHPGFSRWTYSRNDPEKSMDEVLDDTSLYWLTNSATSSGRLYWEYSGRSVTGAATERTAEISLPVAITVSDPFGRHREVERREDIDMNVIRLLAVAVLIVASGVALHPAQAQAPGITRTDLQRHDLSIPGREVIQVVVALGPGVLAPKHTHPGEEIIYVLEGVLEYEVEGKPPVTLKAGDVLFVPAGAAHSARNVGTTNGAELATYIVEKGKPLVTVVK